MGAHQHPTVVPANADADGSDDGEQCEDTTVAGVNDPVAEYSDDVIRRRFASKYSEVNVMAQRGANNEIILARLLAEIEDRGLDPQRALDLHGVPNFVCPECEALGLHNNSGSTTRRECSECGHIGSEEAFLP